MVEDIHGTDVVGGVRVIHGRERSRYELFTQSDLIGFVSYEMKSGYFVLVHAEVRSDHRGRGLGTALATAVFENVGRRGLPTRTSCSFLARFLGPELVDAASGPRSEPIGVLAAQVSDDAHTHAA